MKKLYKFICQKCKKTHYYTKKEFERLDNKKCNNCNRIEKLKKEG